MTYTSECLADSPAGLWLLDETSGTVAADVSGNARHGTYVGPPALATATLHGLSCPVFSGDYVALPDISMGASPHTLEAVMRPDASHGSQGVVLTGREGGSSRVVAAIGAPLANDAATDQMCGGGYSGGGSWGMARGPILTVGATYHVAYTFDGTTGRLYVDGVQAATVTRTGDTSSALGWDVGVNHTRSVYFSGAIAGVALYPTALTAGRVAAHHSALSTVPPAAVAFTATATLTADAAPVPALAAVAFDVTATFAATPEPDVVPPASGSVQFTGTASLDVVTRPIGTRWRLVVTDIYGEPYGELESATCGAISYALNTEEDWSFTLPVSDPKAALVLAERFRECQVWRGDQLLAWGPMIRPAVTKTSVAVSCKGVQWYLSRRTIGKASRTNHVINGDFEDGFNGWNVGALSPFEPLATRFTGWSAAVPTGRSMTGTHSLRLTQTATGTPRYGIGASQFLVWAPVVEPAGDTWTLVTNVYIDSDDWRGPPVDGIGLRLSRYSTTETVTLQPDDGSAGVAFPKPIETVTATIDENTPRDVWIRLEATLRSPVTGAAEFIQITLSAPDGTAYFDRVALTLDEAERYHGDQALIAQGIVEHLQDPAYGKTDLNLSTDMPPTGISRDRTYLHHEHVSGEAALGELVDVGAFDLSVALTATTRTVRTHHPRRGAHRPAHTLELGRNVADFTWAFDGEGAASQIVVLGTGDGSDREEASATDASAYSGGLTLETVFSAPPSTLIDSLDELAIEELTTSINPDVLSVVCTAAQPPTALWPGDTVPVRLTAGAFIIEGTYRVVEVTITPGDIVEYTLNKRDEL